MLNHKRLETHVIKSRLEFHACSLTREIHSYASVGSGHDADHSSLDLSVEVSDAVFEVDGLSGASPVAALVVALLFGLMGQPLWTACGPQMSETTLSIAGSRNGAKNGWRSFM